MYRTGVIIGALVCVAGCDQIRQVQEQVEQAQEHVSEAQDLAEYSMYYAKVGMQLGQVEEQWNTVFPQLNDAARNPPGRPAALAAADGIVDSMNQVVESNRPSNPDASRGHQAAKRMVDRRRAALAQLRTSWEATTDPMESSTQLLSFSNEWMAARNDWMAAVGQESQETLGPAAERAKVQNMGALENAAQGQPPPPPPAVPQGAAQ